MDKYKVKVNPRAIRELDHIYEYIANEKLAPENAKGQVDRIKKAVLSLDTFPQSHQERNEGRYAGKGYRQLLIDHSSNESSASIHVCMVPSRYNLAYSNRLSIARAFKAHSELGVVFNPSSAFAQSIRRIYPA